MNAQASTLSPARAGWCAVLAKLIQPWDAGTATRSLVGMVAALSDLPDEAFTPSIAQGVADRVKRLPTPPSLRSAIASAFAADKPETAAQHLAQQGQHVDHRAAELPVEQRAWVKLWQEKAAAGWCNCGSVQCRKTPRFASGLIRVRSEPAWRFICDTLEGHARITELLGPDAPGLPVSENQDTGPVIAAALSELKVEIGHLQPGAELDEPEETPPAIKSAPPTPEALRAIYQAHYDAARQAGDQHRMDMASTRLAALAA